MSTENRPTKKQREMLNFIANFISGHGYGPSYREIMRGMGYTSPATVAAHIDNLIAKGHLKKRSKSARSLEVVHSQATYESEGATPQDEKWLVDTIERHFKEAEYAKKPTKKQVDNLYVLVGSLHVLGFIGASNSFKERLKVLKKESEIRSQKSE